MVGVAVFESARPYAKLFHVVAADSDAVGMYGGGFLEVVHGIGDFFPRDEIAKRFLPGEKAHGLAAVFGEVSAEEFGRFKAGAEKMEIVDHSVANLGGRKYGSELRLPD